MVGGDRRSIIVLVTVCSAGRKKILATPEAAATLVGVWSAARQWIVGRYVIMPDHVHLFCSPADPNVTLARWVTYWKAKASLAWPRPEEQPIWQQSFWDRQMRSGENYEARWQYVRNNPVRHGLVERAEDWPYSGALEGLAFFET